MIDIVFPQDNEAEFIKIAKKLDYNSLCFVYPFKDFKSEKIKSDLGIKYGVLTDEKNLKKAKKLADVIFVHCLENSRHLIEKNKDIIIFGFEQDPKKDFNNNHIAIYCLKRHQPLLSFPALCRSYPYVSPVRIPAKYAFCNA